MSDKTLEIDGKKYPVPEDFTLGEGCVLEQEFGIDLEKLEQGKGGMSALAGIAWVAMHRADASVTPAQVRDVKMSSFVLDADEELVELPPSEAAEAAPVPSPAENQGLAMIRAAGGGQAS